MKELIRRIEESDFEHAAPLFKVPYKKSIEELKWLFKDPNDKNEYNGFVCISNEELVGVIGYIDVSYTDGTVDFKGVIPMSWQLKENYKGFAGILLFKKVLALGDFCIAIAGSSTAKQMYPMFKYRYLFNIYEYYKVLDLKSSFCLITKKGRLKSLAKLLWLNTARFRINIKFKKTRNVVFENYNQTEEQIKEINYGIIRRKLNKNQINWFLKCPLVKSMAFKVYLDESFLGYVILYIKSQDGCNQGRIVHLPYVDDKHLSYEIFHKCLQILKKHKCSFVSSWLHHDAHSSSLKNHGFKRIKNKIIPFYLKDKRNVFENHNLDNWFLQYSEGDKAYRNFPFFSV
ncbi:hypothetical protein [Lutimonas zeaxanthinifaciens]|uniref:hypothetical protein n=1 Tax=Lutimonas zeaxanthinifaciens TaxID=3060215 RepID=UPI00265D035B|nr:hypothetical protein [Lutimonas sp. YSD2104]WKK66830.1 hypothetical protein QZH61_04225 [Lutimonas sp. YSD2104]